MASSGDMLRLARQLRGFTQKKTAEQLGLAQAVLSRLENGLIDPDDDLIERASKVFDLPSEFFEIGETIYGPPVSVHTMLRGKKSEVSVRDVDMITAELNVRVFHLRRFLENVDLNPVNDIPSLDVEQFDSVSKIASIVRAHWKVSTGPIKNMTRLMERAGVVIGVSDFHGASVSGVTFSAPGQPPLVLINRDHPADRLRFTLAHELGHLVMHRFPTAGMEDEANRFASAFLLPPHEVQEVFRGRKVTIALLASLKKEWRVSMQALLYSAHSLKCITSNQSRYLWQQLSTRGWRTREPASLDFPFDPPSVLPTIIQSHLNQLGFTKFELARMTRVHEQEFDRLYGLSDPSQPIRPTLRIIN